MGDGWRWRVRQPGNTDGGNDMSKDRLLSVGEVAERLGTWERFPRRLIGERRITFVRVGRHVHIPESAVEGMIDAGTVAPVVRRGRGPRGRRPDGR
jgi:excisionase family DNA binding protein